MTTTPDTPQPLPCPFCAVIPLSLFWFFIVTVGVCPLMEINVTASWLLGPTIGLGSFLLACATEKAMQAMADIVEIDRKMKDKRDYQWKKRFEKWNKR